VHSLPVVSYGCEAWYLTVTEENRLRVYQNRVLRRIYGPKREEVAGSWRRLHNEELHNLYLFDKIKKDEMSGACGTNGRGEKCVQNFGR
jgi:hypothetical protein